MSGFREGVRSAMMVASSTPRPGSVSVGADVLSPGRVSAGQDAVAVWLTAAHVEMLASALAGDVPSMSAAVAAAGALWVWLDVTVLSDGRVRVLVTAAARTMMRVELEPGTAAGVAADLRGLLAGGVGP